MRGSRIVLMAAALLLAGASTALAGHHRRGGGTPAPAANTAPVGFLDGKALPISGNATYGLMQGTGWACDDSGIATVDLFVDGIPQVRALTGYLRPAVTRRYPTCTRPGFVFAVDTTKFLNGIHQVTAVATANDGGQVTFGPVRMQFLNAEHMLKPFGRILFPDPDAVMHGRCNLADPTRRFSVIEGVAFDAGVQEDDTGVFNVDLLLDGGLIASTKTSCGFNAAAGGYTNCYGLPSLGWTELFPTLPDSDRAEFRFAVDVGVLHGLGYSEGTHHITIRADDIAGNYKNIADINVFFQCDENEGNEPAIGTLDHPQNEQPYSGTITVDGWATDIDGLAPNGIEVRFNFELDGTTNTTTPRPDIQNLYPGYPNVAGFTYQLDTTKYPDGPGTLEVWATDVFGQRTLIGERRIIVDNHVGP